MNFRLEAENCSSAARIFVDAAASSRDPRLLLLCAGFLKDLALNQPAYLDQTRIAEPFFWELREELALTCKEKSGCHDTLHDHAFRILECAAILSRENSGRSGHAREEQKNVMRYFENCGHWPCDDTSLACSFYYLLIPRCLNAAKGNVVYNRTMP
ncbi:hypothetical protein LJC46_01550 [Desulfovibrio sp. OttesenSCG-928-G15]|nr:hypothetical protein [Desulfovibrio sp. OttesenSCG-928-G15]